MSETATPSALEKRVAAIEERQEHVATKGAISLLGTDIRTLEIRICRALLVQSAVLAIIVLSGVAPIVN